MNRYTIKSHPDSRYTSLELCSEGELVKLADVKVLLDRLVEEKMVDNQYDILEREGLLGNE